MAEVVGLIVSVVLLTLVFLPILSLVRLSRISSELDEIRRRLAALERERSVEAETAVPSVESAPPVVEPSAISPSPSTPAAQDDDGDLEARIGGRGLLYTGVLVLLLGVSFFLKYAFDNAWINETARTVIGVLAGVVLVTGGLRLATRGLTAFGHALAGTGFAILYLVVYAALHVYFLIDRGASFVMMLMITLAAGAAADRRDAQSLALIAVVGGFLTPALIAGPDPTQLTLFAYVALLVLGTVVLSLRRHWPLLNAVSYAGTLVTVLAWTAQYYTASAWLRTLLFLTLFCVAFLRILRATRRYHDLTARLVRAWLWTAPVLYHVAAIVITAGRPPAIHIYLIAFTAVGLWLSVDPHRPLLRLLILLGAFAAMFGDLTLPDGRSWLVANVITIVAVALLHVMALVDRSTRQDEALTGWDMLALHVSGLGLFSLLYTTLQQDYPGVRGVLAAGVAAAALALGYRLRTRDALAWWHCVALAFTLLAIGVAVQVDGMPVVIGWAAEAVALAWIGVRARLPAFQFGGFVLWLLAALRVIESAGTMPAGFTVIANARAAATVFVLVAGYVMAWRFATLGSPEAARMRALVHIGASVLTMVWITSEIGAFWERRQEMAQAHLYEQMLLSLAWGLYGAVLIVAGLWRRYALLRYLGIGVIAITALKVFFYDLWELGGIYRVIGFLGVGALLVLVSYLYQNRRRAPERRDA